MLGYTWQDLITWFISIVLRFCSDFANGFMKKDQIAKCLVDHELRSLDTTHVINGHGSRWNVMENLGRFWTGVLCGKVVLETARTSQSARVFKRGNNHEPERHCK
jgi:hypothetical protein